MWLHLIYKLGFNFLACFVSRWCFSKKKGSKKFAFYGRHPFRFYFCLQIIFQHCFWKLSSCLWFDNLVKVLFVALRLCIFLLFMFVDCEMVVLFTKKVLKHYLSLYTNGCFMINSWIHQDVWVLHFSLLLYTI
jgi:hypothetical protein